MLKNIFTWLSSEKGISIDDYCNLDGMNRLKLHLEFEELGKQEYINELRQELAVPLAR